MLPEFLQGDFLDRGQRRAIAGIIDQDINATGLTFDSGEQGFDLFFGSDVSGEELKMIGGNCLFRGRPIFTGPADPKYRIAEVDKLSSQGEPQAATGSGDDDYSVHRPVGST